MTISYVVIAYNTEKYIKKCIESILNQPHHEQIIVINDGSTDKTEDVIKSFNNKEIVYIKHDKNKGCCYSRMEGMKLCNCDYMTFIDSDDYYINNLPKLNIFSPDIIDFGMHGAFNSMEETKDIISKVKGRIHGSKIWDYYIKEKINQILVNKLIKRRLYKKVVDNLYIDDLSNYCDNISIMSAYAYYARSYKVNNNICYYYRQGSGMTTYLPRLEKFKCYCNQKEAVKRLSKLGMNEDELMLQVTIRVCNYYNWIYKVANAIKQEKDKKLKKEAISELKVNEGDEVKAKKILLENFKTEIKKYNLEVK